MWKCQADGIVELEVPANSPLVHPVVGRRNRPPLGLRAAPVHVTEFFVSDEAALARGRILRAARLPVSLLAGDEGVALLIRRRGADGTIDLRVIEP